MPNNIQPREYSKGSGTDSLTHNSFEGNRNACYVWWNDSKRKANLNWIENFDNSYDWFAFRNSFISLPFLRGSFVLAIGHSNHRAFCQSLLVLQIWPHIF